jgi:hypothetical protein
MNDSKDSSLGIVTGYGLECSGSLPGRDKRFLHLHCIHTSLEAHTVSCPLAIRDPFPDRTVVEA